MLKLHCVCIFDPLSKLPFPSFPLLLFCTVFVENAESLQICQCHLKTVWFESFVVVELLYVNATEIIWLFSDSSRISINHGLNAW